MNKIMETNNQINQNLYQQQLFQQPYQQQMNQIPLQAQNQQYEQIVKNQRIGQQQMQPYLGQKNKLKITEQFNELNNEIKDSINEVKFQIDKIIKASLINNSIKNQLNNINRMLNMINEYIKENNERIKILFLGHNNINKEDEINIDNNKYNITNNKKIKKL